MDSSVTSQNGPSLFQLFVDAIHSLRLLGRRSLLALLGIIVGSASIVALLHIGRNAADESLRSFKDLGSDILVVSFPDPAQPNKRPLPSTLNTVSLKPAIPSIKFIAPMTLDSASVNLNGHTTGSTLVGATADLAPALGLKIKEGRFLSDFDYRETFVVVGARVARDLSINGKPLQIGHMLQIENYLFRVIGIINTLPTNALIPVAVDESVILPINGMRRLRPSPEITNVIGKVVSTADLPTTANELHRYMSERLNGRDVDVQIPQYLLDGLKRQANTFSYLLAGLGGISLLAGGVGVMNVMLMNVSERRREIGIRMALGARPRDIRDLFLLEAGILCAIGSLVGGIFGVVIAYVFTQFTGWIFSFTPESLALGCGSSLLIGLFFGLYPAISAAQLQPVQALRHV